MNDLTSLKTTDIVFNCQLTKQEAGLLEEAKSNVLKSFRDGQVYRTETEFNISVLNDVSHPTPDSKYWQCHLEMKCHSDQLVLLDFDIRIKEAEIEELEEKDRSKKEDIELEKERYFLTHLKKQVKDRVKEIDQINKAMDRLKPECLFSTEDVNEHQIFSYLFRFAREVSYVSSANGTTGGEKKNMIAHLVTALSRIKANPKYSEKLLKIMPEDVYNILVNFKLLKEIEE